MKTKPTTESKRVPFISDAEFAERFARAQVAVREAGYDALLVNSNEADFSNVRYFSDYWPIFETAGVLIPAEGPGALLIGPESEAFARDRSKIEQIFKMTAYRESADPAYPGIPTYGFKGVFDAMSLPEPKRIGVGGYLVTTAPQLDALREAFPNAEIERADRIMNNLRAIKSEAELDCLRAAFRISEQAIRAVQQEIAPGMTELDVVGIVQREIYRGGAEYEGMPQYVLSGPNTRHAISRPTHRELKAGELVQLNISARVSGYSSGVGIPVCLGKMNDQQRDLVSFGLEAHHKTIEWLKAGKIAGDIARQYEQYYQDHGRGDNFLYGPCHGLGMMEVEPPWMEETDDYSLREGMCFQVDSFTSGPSFGLRWENGGRITSEGFELFSRSFDLPVELG